MSDGVTIDDLLRWREALSTCAIENNQYAIEQLKLWKTDRVAFTKEYLRQQVEL
ncbi:hypothetical protein LCGC14_1432630 [marine sediment metagenome]|uniref:Uncharacterized protein n=1 Tax=marine sediment metagenome TaxID=412755 RepID=A0A0F9JNH9_9ZZZZ